MRFTRAAIPEIILIEPESYEDERGFFMEIFRANVFAKQRIQQPFVQENHSGSRQGVLRGLHYQIRQPQGKLVRAVVGEIFDASVDLRESSRTFGQWFGVALSNESRRMLWVPPGFAHGYYVLSDWAEVSYKVTDYYAPNWERTLLWDDPELNIQWPLPGGEPPLLSAKDAKGKPLSEAEIFA